MTPRPARPFSRAEFLTALQLLISWRRVDCASAVAVQGLSF